MKAGDKIIYTKKNLNIITFIISLIIFVLLNFIYNFISKAYFKEVAENTVENKLINNEITVDNNKTNENSINKVVESNKKVKNEKKKTNWKIEIKAISLSAEIAEGTTDNIMNKYVGHFDSSPKKEGNVCLAAHNRGYPVNYFKDLKKLKIGDEIKYTYGKFQKTYIVDKTDIIEDIDWSCLENTEDNRITLITCVENEPNYRRCIQGIEK